MSTTRIVQCVFLASLPCVIGSESRAEPMPLLTLTTSPLATNLNPAGETSFVVGLGFGDHLWTMTTTANTNPGEVFAETPVISAFQSRNDSGGGIWEATDFSSETYLRGDYLWCGCDIPAIDERHVDPAGFSQPHVPQIGPWFTGYALSDVSMHITYTVDDLGFTPSARIRLRFFGEPIFVPEPTVALLFMCGFVGGHFRIRRRADSIAGR
jgi:hypothetical protein